MSSSPAAAATAAGLELAARARARVTSPYTSKKPHFHLPLPKRVHVPKHVRTADLRMSIALHNKPRDFAREHLVIRTSRSRRDALPLEKLGEWDPLPRERRILPADGGSAAPASFAGKDATRHEVRIELAQQKIKWWLEVGGAQPTKAAVKLLESTGVLKEGEHPYNYTPKVRPVTETRLQPHWPDYAPPTAERTPGVRIRGTAYVLPDGQEVAPAHPDLPAQTAEAAARDRAARAAAAEQRAAERAERERAAAAERAAEQAAKEAKLADALDRYRAKFALALAQVKEEDVAAERERAEARAREQAELAKAEGEPAAAAATEAVAAAAAAAAEAKTPVEQAEVKDASQPSSSESESAPPAEAAPPAPEHK